MPTYYTLTDIPIVGKLSPPSGSIPDSENRYTLDLVQRSGKDHATCLASCSNSQSFPSQPEQQKACCQANEEDQSGQNQRQVPRLLCFETVFYLGLRMGVGFTGTYGHRCVFESTERHVLYFDSSIHDYLCYLCVCICTGTY